MIMENLLKQDLRRGRGRAEIIHQSEWPHGRIIGLDGAMKKSSLAPSLFGDSSLLSQAYAIAMAI